jgi:hypothetical protein
MVTARIVESRDSALDISQNPALFGLGACSGSSFAGDVSPELCVVRNETTFSIAAPPRSTDAMTRNQHRIASFELHVPPRRRM